MDSVVHIGSIGVERIFLRDQNKCFFNITLLSHIISSYKANNVARLICVHAVSSAFEQITGRTKIQENSFNF